MTLKSPWHSKEPYDEVYHDNTDCTEGDNIETYNAEKEKGLGQGNVLIARGSIETSYFFLKK